MARFIVKMSRFIIKSSILVGTLSLIYGVFMYQMFIPAKRYQALIKRTGACDCTTLDVIAHALGYLDFRSPTRCYKSVLWAGGPDDECTSAQKSLYYKLAGRECHLPVEIVTERLKIQEEKEGTWIFNENCPPIPMPRLDED